MRSSTAGSHGTRTRSPGRTTRYWPERHSGVGYRAQVAGSAALAFAQRHAHNNIRVNAVCPGPTHTRFRDGGGGHQHARAVGPLGRLAVPEEAAAVRLCSDGH
ncbi:SDR family oxidoreductase [Nocardia sp. NBC_01499]|uniref:SDR family oxidoreductase n=1 Tax=Nocardia sp. NBC_01499 TaxID=2903597 RepID=UPI00386584BB